MPTYEYECRKCRTRFERQQRITEAPLTTCDDCGGEVYRVIQPVGIAFKGSGFHVNDYGRNGRKNGSATPKPCEGSESKSCPAAESCSSGACPAAKSD
jgi:putative FmdB family regulatory protein